MIRKINEIISLAVELTTSTDADIFVEYAGHTHQLDVSIFQNGWNKRKEFPLRKWTCFLDQDWDKPMEKLDEIIEILEELKGE